MCRIYALLLIFLYLAGNVYSQTNQSVRASVANQLRFGSGQENNVGGNISKEYFEELGNARLFISDFLIGARFEYDAPIEFGKGIKGISQRFIEFKKEGFTVRAGNFYELFSKGLTLNSFESRPIGWNTQFDGVKLNYKQTFGKKKPVKLTATILGGDINYTNFLDTGRTETYSIRAANFSVSPVKMLSLGGSYLFTNGQIPTGNIITKISAEMFEGNLTFGLKGLDLIASYASKVTISEPNIIYPKSKAPQGDGGYGSVSFTKKGFGITLDYKNYRFNLVTPDQRSATDPYKPLPFQLGPTAIIEHSSTLLSRLPHTVDMGDEVGWQVDVYYSPNDKLTFNGNVSLTSRHYNYRDADTTVLTRYERIDRSNSFLPSFDDPFSPFWEVYLEAEYYWTKDLKTKIGISRKTSVLYSIVDPKSSEKTRTFTIPIEVQYTYAKIFGITLNTEFQSGYNSLRAGDKNYLNEYTSIALTRSPDLIIAGILEVSNDKEDPSGKRYWLKGELTYKFSSANTVMVSYGSERGGLQCSSGICRYINPFSGARLTITNNFN